MLFQRPMLPRSSLKVCGGWVGEWVGGWVVVVGVETKFSDQLRTKLINNLYFCSVLKLRKY